MWAAIVAVLVIAAVAVGWGALAQRNSSDKAQGLSCAEGEATLTVWADPAAEGRANDLASSYNASSPTVRDHCVTAVVRTVNTAAAYQAYRVGGPGVAPVWIPASGNFVAGLPGAPDTLPVVHTDDLGYSVPDGLQPDAAQAVAPKGTASAASALAAEALAVTGDEPDADRAVETGAQNDLTTALDGDAPVLTARTLADGHAGRSFVPVAAPDPAPAPD
ncbi:hypothetical protein, partial [Corynebacterium bovis]